MNEELKARITNLLQDRKGGLTVEQLKKRLKLSVESVILVELHELLKEGIAVQSGTVWLLNRTPQTEGVTSPR